MKEIWKYSCIDEVIDDQLEEYIKKQKEKENNEIKNIKNK